MAGNYVLRTDLRPGDLGAVVRMHGVEYAQDNGFDWTFEAYVAGSLAEAVKAFDDARDRIWLAEQGDRLVGTIGIIGLANGIAQLRWYLVAREARGTGLGRELLREALGFCRRTDRRRVVLWTVGELRAAARLYTNAGFRLVEEKPQEQWGRHVVEQRYELILVEDRSSAAGRSNSD